MSLTPTSLDSFKCRQTLTVGGKSYEYFSLPDAERNGLAGISKLPFSLKVLLENLLRSRGRPLGQGRRHPCHGRLARDQDLQGRDRLSAGARAAAGFHRRALRRRSGGHARRHADDGRRSRRRSIRWCRSISSSTTPCRSTIFGHADSFKKNVDIEYERNKERYEFLRWGGSAFNNFKVVPPGTGICHQVNLEYLAQTVWTRPGVRPHEQAFPDTCIGTDSHTTMVNGLAVLGWGVGGIEAEAAMLGQPVAMVDSRGDRLPPEGPAQGRHHGHRPRADRARRCSGSAASSRNSSSSSATASITLSSRIAPRSPTWRPNTAPPAASSRLTATP